MQAKVHQIGHNRFEPFTPPENDESIQVILMAARPLLECLALIPAKWFWAHISNKKLFECCREPENLTLEVRKTQPSVPKADLYVIQCGCGRKHRRMLCDPIPYGDAPRRINYNPLFNEAEHAPPCT